MNLRSLLYFVGLTAVFLATLNFPRLEMLIGFAILAFMSHLDGLIRMIGGPTSIRQRKAAYLFGGYSYIAFTLLLDINWATDSIMEPFTHWVVFAISPHHPDSDAWSVDFSHSLVACEIMLSILVSLACYWVAYAHLRWNNADDVAI